MPALILMKIPEGVTTSKTIQLTEGAQTIGRDAGRCQIVIPHHAVSREHARITFKNGQFYIEDGDGRGNLSRNHTFVNSKEITATPVPLKADDRIKICDFLFQFRDERTQKLGKLPPWMQKEQPEEDDDTGEWTMIEAIPGVGWGSDSQVMRRPSPDEVPAEEPASPVVVNAGSQAVADYLAPEQIHERADSPLTEATDLHALGVILFQMLTGGLPFPPGLREGAKLDAIARRQFASCEAACRASGVDSRVAPIVDRILRGGEYRRARFLLADLERVAPGGTPPPAAPRVEDERFVVTGFLFEDRLTETFTAVGSSSRTVVNLRLVKHGYDTQDVRDLFRALAPTPADAPPGFLRRHRVGRGHPIPVAVRTRFQVEPIESGGGCLTLVEEYAGPQTLIAAIRDRVFVGNDDAVVRVAVPLLRALDYAHARGTIHARLTPYCVFLPDHGVKVEGFGPLPDHPGAGGQLGLGIHAGIEAMRMARGGDSTGLSTVGGNRITAGFRPADPAPDPHTVASIVGTNRTAGPPLAAQSSDRLEALLDISVGLSRTLELEPLLTQIADTLLGTFKQADRCFVLQLDESMRPIPRVIKTRRVGHDDTRFSKTIVKKTIESMQSFLSEDASRDGTFGPAASIAEFKIRSVMCVPLADANGRPLGAIQIDTLEGGNKFSTEDLKLVTAVANLASVAVEKARMHEAVLAREKEQKEIELARSVLLGFLPQTLPQVEGYEFYSHYSPAQTVGGDYYDFIPLPGGRVAVVLGDVAGRGVPAALLVAKLSSEVKFSLVTEPTLAKAITSLNDQMIRGGLQDRYLTLVVMVLDPATHQLTVVNAGHMNPKLYRGTRGDLVEATTNEVAGLPLGVMPGFEYEAVTLTLEPGDTLSVYTDGVTDAMNPGGEMFGFERVDRFVTPDESALADAGRPKRVGERLVTEVRKHANGRAQNDDIAVVCFGRLEPGTGPGVSPARGTTPWVPK